MKEYVVTKTGEFFAGLWTLIYGCSYWIALAVGLTAIMMYLCGHRKALKWVWTSVIGYALLSALGGL